MPVLALQMQESALPVKLLHSTCQAGVYTGSLGHRAATSLSKPGPLCHSTCSGHTYHSILAVCATVLLPLDCSCNRACKANSTQTKLVQVARYAPCWTSSNLSYLATSNQMQQIGCKWSVMFKSHVENCIDWKSYIFNLNIFEQPKIIIYCVNDQPSITQSQIYVLNFKFSVLTFLRLMSLSKICVKRNDNSNLCLMQSNASIKGQWLIIAYSLGAVWPEKAWPLFFL